MTQGSGDEILKRADEMAQFSAMEKGLTRAYLTKEHKQAHQQLSHWMALAGLEVWQDSVGNQWGRKASSNPTQPTLIIGSHSDTVVNAGKYDGNLGILLGLEALKQLEGIDLPFHVDLVAFADEEGVRFYTTLIGSSATAGCFQPAWLDIKDSDNIAMGEAMLSFGLPPELAGKDARLPQEVKAYLEVHIEQGPVLEDLNLPVGVVTGIAGAKRYQLSVKGMAGHAGTVPHALRMDALCGVAEMITTIETYGLEHNVVATVGKCDVKPGAVNVIPGDVVFSLDVRSPVQGDLEVACNELHSQLEEIAQRRELQLTSELTYQAEAVPCNAELQQQWGKVVEKKTGTKACFLPSGAGHDAMVMANITDIGMLFVRCEKGISHNPREQVNAQDITVALNCLVDMVQLLANSDSAEA
ncbi:allantoate amidohydrolase [Vibrio breoganii]|uniref:Zn-dependent hydrolase n=1 Tax=Vibrio breoganii TaxID=553239 RepID=A0AAP8MT58_9VIBR|nr:allantoate amidohydrolase [Vibrio breoganii]PMM19378.1 Zn-dependent hydrolase [Vibrio breoganii]PMP06980.1 Zn-dependent hydrolase [Vibrio breoganii]